MSDIEQELAQLDPQEVRMITAEFAKIDRNGDNLITPEEMNEFLRQKGVDEEHRS